MPPRMSTANIITLSRLPLLMLVAWLLSLPWAWPAFVALGLLPVLFLMDWFDGFYARQRNQVTDLGSVLDIAIDRVVENALWIVFTHLDRAPVWAPLVFITRSFVIDGLRSYALAKGHSAFGMMRSALGRFLVAGRFMRGLYGLAKGAAGLVLWAAGAAWSLTAEEVLRLKNAGVSEETIQRMIEQDQRSGGQAGPVSETRDQVIYRAGPTDQEIEAQERRERRKEEKALDAAGNVIIDQRRGQPPQRRPPAGPGD